MKKTAIFMILSTVMIASCAKRGPTDEQISNADYGTVPVNQKEIVINHVKMRLYDHGSAQYDKWSNLVKGWSNGYDGTHYGYKGCVYINSKNRMGGYVGFKPYVYIIRNDNVVFINGDMQSGTVGEQEILRQCSAIYQQVKTMP